VNLALLRKLSFLLLAIAPAPALADSSALPEQATETALEQIELAIAAGRLVQAGSMLNGIQSDLSANQVERHALLSAELYMATGDAAAAAKAIAPLSANTAEPCRYGAVAGWLAYQAGDWNRAIAMLAKSVETCAADPGRWNLLGLALMRKNELPAALEAFDHALMLAPAHAALLNNRALVHAYSGQTEDAIAGLERAAQLEPANGGIIANLAVLKANVGMTPDVDGAQSPQVQAMILEKAGQGALAADRVEAARSYFTEALLRSERFDQNLWASATSAQSAVEQGPIDASHD
jgi:Flp pilus assembly protein TadD